MSVNSFELLNVNFVKKGVHWVFMNGEILNNTNRNYVSAVFRLSIFESTHLLWTGPVKVRNFRKRQARSFEVQLEKLGYDCVPRISRYEIYFESGY